MLRGNVALILTPTIPPPSPHLPPHFRRTRSTRTQVPQQQYPGFYTDYSIGWLAQLPRDDSPGGSGRPGCFWKVFKDE